MKFIELIVEILNRIQETCLTNHDIKNSITEDQVNVLCQTIIDIESSKSISERLILSFYNFIKFLLIKNFINHEKQVNNIFNLEKFKFLTNFIFY